MIYKRLAFWMILWCIERVLEHFLRKLEERSWVESLIKRQKRPRELKTVAGQLQLVCGVNVLNCKSNARPTRRLNKPKEVITLLSLLEINAIVAWSLKAKLINGILGNLSLYFALLFSMSYKLYHITHKMSKSWIYSSCSQNQSSLPIFPLFR